jgi:cytochrome b561
MNGAVMQADTHVRYGKLTQALHWATALLVLIAFIYGPGGSETRIFSAAHDFDRQLHETLGMCVLALAAVRLLWRLVDVRPPPVQGSRWLRLASTGVQGMLYLLLFAVPLTAIAGSWLEGHPLTLLGGLEIASLIGKSHDLGADILEIHTWLGDTILWLAGFHALASLFHHVVLKDAVLETMLPRGFPLWRPGKN